MDDHTRNGSGAAEPPWGPEVRVSFARYRYLVLSDLYRHTGALGKKTFIKSILFNPGFKYAFCIRTGAYLKHHPIFRYNLFHLSRMVQKHFTYKYGVDITYNTRIGPGLHICHINGIGVSPGAKIGANCTISQLVVIGRANRGKREGYPTIGDNVYLGPGAKIVGRLTIGNNVAVGANCVVIDDVPDGAVVGGIPGKVIATGGSEGYTTHTDYERFLGEFPPA